MIPMSFLHVYDFEIIWRILFCMDSNRNMFKGLDFVQHFGIIGRFHIFLVLKLF